MVIPVTTQRSGPKEHVLTRLKITDRADWPWSFDSLNDEDLAGDLADVLVDWVTDYNETWVVTDTQLIPSCWPVHPALAREIAVLYSAWAVAFHSPTTTSPDHAVSWLERTLPGFHRRMETWLGTEPSACRAGKHPSSWNDAAEKVTRAVEAADRTRQRLRDEYVARLATSRSQPRPHRLTNFDLADVYRVINTDESPDDDQ